MPPEQLYGKRPRAVYDPFQAFVSPQRPTPKGNLRDEGIFVAEVVEELSRLKVTDGKKQNVRRDGRKALGEKSANEVVEEKGLGRKESKGKRRRRKIVEEDDDEGEDVPKPESPRRLARGRYRSHKDAASQELAKANQKNSDFVADNVAMFVDGHGYGTGDDEPVEQAHKDGFKWPQSSSRPDKPPSEQYETSHEPATPSITVLPPTPQPADDVYTSHCAPLLALSPHGITNFTEWTNQLTTHFALTKIAEASFGEVYRLSLLEDLSAFSHADESVLKVIALKPSETSMPNASKKKERKAALKKGEAMSKVEDVANEVKLLQRMSSIPGFTNFRDIRVIQGRPPQAFISAFRAFNTEQKKRKKEGSIFPDPAKKTSYPEDQLWAVIEMQDAGTDLERHVEQGICGSIWTVWDVFWQVVLTLGKGEEGAEFEHRDLHLGNICVRGELCPKDKDIDPRTKLGFTGCETTVIDYTISRCLLSGKPASRAAGAKEPEIACHDLGIQNPVFEGDSTEEYQYDIYRYMRGAVLQGDAYWNPPDPSTTEAAETKEWRQYHPSTNLLWLHYLLHQLLESLLWPSATKPPPKKMNSGHDHALWKRANDLEFVLLRVQELLDPGVVCGGGEGGDGEGRIGSAGALVGLALEEGWLGVGDVVGDVGEEGDDVEVADLAQSLQDMAVGEGDTLLQAEEGKGVKGEEAETKSGAREARSNGRSRRKKQ